MKVRVEFEVEVPDTFAQQIASAALELVEIAKATDRPRSRAVPVREGIEAIVTVTP